MEYSKTDLNLFIVTIIVFTALTFQNLAVTLPIAGFNIQKFYMALALR